jgi:hypothetical protein
MTSNKAQISLYKQSKEGLKSLFVQTTQVSIGLGLMLILTAGNPPGWLVSASFFVGIGFVAWSESKRQSEFDPREEKSESKGQNRLIDQPLTIDIDKFNIDIDKFNSKPRNTKMTVYLKKLLNPPEREEKIETTIKLPPKLYLCILKQAFAKDMSVVELLEEVFLETEEFEDPPPEEEQKGADWHRISWEEDLKNLIDERENLVDEDKSD